MAIVERRRCWRRLASCCRLCATFRTLGSPWSRFDDFILRAILEASDACETRAGCCEAQANTTETWPAAFDPGADFTTISTFRPNFVRHSIISRLEASLRSDKGSPSFATLRKYARACHVLLCQTRLAARIEQGGQGRIFLVQCLACEALPKPSRALVCARLAHHRVDDEAAQPVMAPQADHVARRHVAQQRIFGLEPRRGLVQIPVKLFCHQIDRAGDFFPDVRARQPV